MELVKAISSVNIRENLFGIGEVSLEANVPKEIPKEAFDAWKYRKYPVELCTEPVEDTKENSTVDDLDNMEYNDLKMLTKKLGIGVPRSIKKADLIALIRNARGERENGEH